MAKKKTQLKPVARGFATTSVPKKVTPAPEPEPVAVPSTESGAAQSHPNAPNSKETQGSSQIIPQVDPEQEYLQSCIDKHQERTEREINRTVKAIEQDRRFSQSLTPLQLDQSFIEQILRLITETESPAAPHTLEEPESKALPKLAITYGTLRRLGFPEDDVCTCLESISSIELDDAIEWLHVHCEEEALRNTDEEFKPSGPRDVDIPKTPRTPRSSSHSTTPSMSATVVSSGRSTPTLNGLDPFATPFVPSHQVTRSEGVKSAVASQGVSARKASAPDYSLDDPTAAFVHVKMQIADLTTHRKPGETQDASFLRGLQKSLADIKNDYLFDEDEAEHAYKVERSRADAAALEARLRSVESISTPVRKPADTPALGAEKPPPDDIFDDAEEGSSGGLFELLEEMPATETTAQGTTVTVRDLSLPKNFSGRTPKTLLQETIRKVDKYAVVLYRSVSGASRAKRAAVSVRWDGRKAEEWVMEDVACHDMIQAENYISTIALHALSYPPQEGFALGVATGTSNQTSFRVLPPIFRDLWGELEDKRRETNDAFNRGIWSKLKSILEPKLATGSKTSNIASRDVESQPSRPARQTRVDPTESANLMAEFQARQARPAYQEMLRRRNELPIAKWRHEIIDTLETSQILVLSGETGCGKSTQLPAFILEDQLSRGIPCKIVCTEPRRISAISLAQRVSVELGEPADAVGTVGSVVGYTVRLESNTSRTTRLQFVTNGIALRMLEGGSGHGGQGTAFDDITHIIIDEVHERTIESDFLLIVLQSLLIQRPDLRVVLMSATVDADKISKYFGGCPVLQVPGRTFPVDVKFLEDAVEFTKWKIAENSPYARRGNSYKGKTWSEEMVPADDDDDMGSTANVKLGKRYSPCTASTINLLDDRLIPFDLIVRLLECICFEDPVHMSFSSAILVFMPGIGDIRQLNDMLMEHRLFGSEAQFRIHPLHSSIASEHQGAVFDIPPPGIRKIVIATNIAETGITIPDITCVIDTGRHREMRFDEKRQISRLVDTYVAKSNAAQRRGRAGRVQPGICFHLFTKYRHDTKMADHPDPEIMRLSLSDLALRIKIMKVNLGTSIEDVLLRALDPPLSVNIQRAVASLIEVRALTPSEEITPMGRLLSKLPTDVHLGKFLLVATLFRCLDPALTIAATLNSKSPFLTPFGMAEEADRAKLTFRTENSDFLTIHNAFSTWRNACANGAARKLCRQYFLSHQNLLQIEELRQQYLGYLVDSGFVQVDRVFTRELSRSRFSRGRPRFVNVPPELNVNAANTWILNSALAAGLYPRILSIDVLKDGKSDLRTISNNQAVAFHPSSVNFGRRAKDFGVNHLCYFTLMHSKKLYAWETGSVEDMALLLLCGEVDFRLMSYTATIDRKVKFRIEPKSGVALKYLRNQLGQLLAAQYRCKPLTDVQSRWNDLAKMILGKVEIKETPEREETVTLIVNR
ncbi:P-loop containing nucleoside triphosphate hydrolase protein [Cristinia sonorae]|uniref:RNA helicase n=1 Tax=Cristinia sonorae TaxID=1940300 RepID=A0A8K0UNH3_9AGAR|nr:P-loop containing nucleoside triphosphate hydrolase protein [Cristinia sonorae]